ncbi:MAG: hypothetical protein IJP17_08185, partial [Clostridia bacterium]|nr:hypothetical protein [Clostridia bacterium]
MKDGFIKIAAAVPKIRLGDCASNAERIIALVEEMAAQGVKLAAFPEMCVTGYSIGSLAAQYTMLDGAQAAVGRIAEATARYDMLLAVGAPVAVGAGIFDCAVVMCRGRILGIVPECEMPASFVRYAGQSDIPFGGGMIFSCDCCDAKVGFEIGEDVASVSRCTDSMALGGANIIFNLSAGGELVGKAQRRHDLVKAQSLRCLCAYAFVGAGAGESTTASVYAGHCIICENGKALSEQRWQSDSFITADIDLQIINCERRREDFFAAEDEGCQTIPFELSADDVCLARHGCSLHYVNFDIPASAQGKLYKSYSSSTKKGTEIESSTKCYRSGSPSLSSIVFVPNESFSGGVSIGYTAYDTNGASYRGTVSVVVGTSAMTNVFYSTERNAPVGFNAADFDVVSVAATGYHVRSVRFYTPSSSVGTLYY